MKGGTDHTRFAAATPYTTALLASALRLVDRAVVADIELHATRVGAEGRLYDLRAMLNEHEHAPQCIDMAREALAYAHARGLVVCPDPANAMLVLIVAPLDL